MRVWTVELSKIVSIEVSSNDKEKIALPCLQYLLEHNYKTYKEIIHNVGRKSFVMARDLKLIKYWGEVT